MVKVPVVLMLVPLSWKADVALTIPVARVALVPLSVNVRSVFGVPSASLIVRMPLLPAVASVILGVLCESTNGDALEKVLDDVKVFAWFW